MDRPNLLCAALWLALSSTAHAQDARIATEDPLGSIQTEPAKVNALDQIQVTATRSQRAVSDVPSTVDVIDRVRMDDILARDIKALVRYEPGISVTSSFGRFGLGGFRIRGLDANRVRVQTDGIDVSDAFAIGSYSNANRNFVDMDTLKRVEIVRGPASALYGSDALGGVVSFVTKDPSDYLEDGKDAYFGLKFGYEGDWNGLFAGATAAFGGQRWSGMAVVNHRQGQEPENMGRDRSDGASRTAPNPQDRDGRSVLTKLVFAPSADQRLVLTVEGNEDNTQTDVRTARGFSALTRATTLDQTGEDHQTRARVSLSHQLDALDAAFADSLDWQVYRQESETTQKTREQRSTAAAGLHWRDRTFNFDQRTDGLQVNLLKSLTTGRAQHTLRYGLDLSRDRVRQKRDGLVTDAATGATTPVMLPDVFPVRDFPISRQTNAAAYVQDEIAFGSRFSLVPGLRVDHYSLEPQLDNLFAEDNPGVQVSDVNKTSVSPKLGAVWHFADDWSLYGGYARGFRAPPYSDVNIGFTNFAFGYTAIPNPDLKPETSNGYEVGLRYSGRKAYAALSVYDNHYRDFIESQRFIGFNDQGLMVYQSQNVAEAQIYGAELKAGLELDALAAGLKGWSLRGSAAWSRGQDRTADVPLDSVDPLRGSLGLAFAGDGWGAELAGTFARRKDRVSNAGDDRPAGYGVVDLLAHWAFAPGAKVNVGVFNLGDRRYIDWVDMPTGAATASSINDRYTHAGRSFSTSLSVQW